MINGQYFPSAATVHPKQVRKWSLFAAMFLAGMSVCVPARAQFGSFFGRGGFVVGGVSIDADGTLRSSTQLEKANLLKDLRNAVRQPSGEVANQTQLRMVSLTRLQAEIERAMATGNSLSEDVIYLAGLQRIEYVFVYPEENDIVIAGPAEGWVVRDDASVVGQTTGKPVIQLEDLLTALRTTRKAQQAPITVSIDPTPEGERRLRQFLGQIKTGPGFNPNLVESKMKQVFGPQTVTLTSVATDSRMASTLVAADYQMKRLAMDIDQSPVAGLPSYLDMIRNSGASAAQPRWWMACDYDAILHSDDMLAWHVTGAGVKAMTEDEIVSATGQRSQTGRANKVAQRWADNFTKKFDELASHNAAFGDLRNAMDLNIVATVIAAHELEAVAGCDFGILRGTTGSLKTPEWRVPVSVAPECSFVKGRAGWTISASGGVEINPWKVVATQSKTDDSLTSTLVKARPAGTNWWWN